MIKRLLLNLTVKKILVSIFVIWMLNLFCALNFDICHSSFAQDSDLEFTLDITSKVVPLPKIFRPNVDLSGRGFHRQSSWPQGVAASEVLDIWQKEIGFGGVYRLQYNLSEISELAKDKVLQDSLLNNYENIIKRITDSGGVVILDIFGTPTGLGKVLDRRSSPIDLKEFKALVKIIIKNFSCDKRYNIWYEIWSAPDLDEFFLGRKQEYLDLYRAVGEAINELEEETKVHIPLGGPSISWWFKNFDGNTIVTPERSLIYELIKLCSRYRLPLDFISWHAYSTDPKTEKETTFYRNTVVALIRDWLSYFNFDRNTPLIVDEWNYDSGTNVLAERYEKSNVCASYVPSRIKNMYEAGVDYQPYFCLEDFQNNKEGVVRNVGIFWFDPAASEYKGGPKSIYNVFRMLTYLGNDLFVSASKLNDEFTGVIATKTKDNNITIIIYNYIDPEIVKSYLSNNIASLNGTDRKALLRIIKSDGLNKIINQELDPFKARVSNKVKTILKKAQELNAKAIKFKSSSRNINIGIKNLKDDYLYQRYTIDSACAFNCAFLPVEEKDVSNTDFQEVLTLNPYSVNMIILMKKPKVAENIVTPATNTQETTNANSSQDTISESENKNKDNIRVDSDPNVAILLK